MTQQLRTTIEPGDVKAIEIECNRCHFRIVRRLDNWLRDSAMCPNCQEHWGNTNGHVLEYIKGIAEYLRQVASRAEEGLPFTVRLEIEGLEKP